LSDAIGYKYFFVWVMGSTLASFIVTWLVPFKNEQEVAAENEAAGAGSRRLTRRRLGSVALGHILPLAQPVSLRGRRVPGVERPFADAIRPKHRHGT